MPKYKITIGGRNFQVTAPNPEALTDIAEIISQQESITTITQPTPTPVARREPRGATGTFAEPETKPGLPRHGEVERRIAGREDILPSAIESLREPVEPTSFLRGQLLRPSFGPQPADIWKGIRLAGGISQRAMAAVTNPLLSLQEGKVLGREGAGLWRDVMRGVKGERLGEIRDIYRKVGVPNWLSTTLGIIAEAGAVNVLTKGKLVTGLKKVEKVATTRVVPKRMSRGFHLQRAQMIDDGVDDIYKGISKEYDDIMAKIGNNPITDDVLDEFRDTLTQNAAAEAKATRIVKTLFGKGEPVPDKLNSIKRMRTAIRQSIPQKVWNHRGVPDESQRVLMEAYDDLSNVMASNAGTERKAYLALNKKYAKFASGRNSIRRMIYDADGKIKTTELPGLFGRTQEGKVKILTDFQKDFYPGMNDILRDLAAFGRRQKLYKVGIGGIAVGGLGYYGRRKIADVLPGETGGGGELQR